MSKELAWLWSNRLQFGDKVLVIPKSPITSLDGCLVTITGLIITHTSRRARIEIGRRLAPVTKFDNLVKRGQEYFYRNSVLQFGVSCHKLMKVTHYRAIKYKGYNYVPNTYPYEPWVTIPNWFKMNPDWVYQFAVQEDEDDEPVPLQINKWWYYVQE